MCSYGHPAHLKPCIISKHLGHFAVHISNADVLTSILTSLLFLRSRHSSHISFLWKVPELVGAQFPFGSRAVDSCPAISGRPEHNYGGKRWSFGVEVLCGCTDGEHEITKPKCLLSLNNK